MNLIKFKNKWVLICNKKINKTHFSFNKIRTLCEDVNLRLDLQKNFVVVFFNERKIINQVRKKKKSFTIFVLCRF